MSYRRIEMNLKSRTIVTLSWTLVAAIILGFVSCESSTSSATISSDPRTARKYLELDDLNSGHKGPESKLTSGEEVDETRAFESSARLEAPKKFVKRSANPQSSNAGQTRQQQLQQQRARNARQNPKKQRPGFFWTLAKVTFETFNDTKSAIQQIGEIINEAIPPDPPARKPSKKPLGLKPVPSKPTGVTKTSSLTSINGTTTTTTSAPTTTTEAEFKLTRPLLQSLVRRNVKGLVRLFNIEWRDALNQSSRNVQEFHRDLGKQIAIQLQDNPDAY